MSQLLAALRRKYSTPQAAVKALGLDAALLEERNDMSSLKELSRRQKQLAQDASEFFENLEKEGEGEEDRGEDRRRDDADDRRRDDADDRRRDDADDRRRDDADDAGMIRTRGVRGRDRRRARDDDPNSGIPVREADNPELGMPGEDAALDWYADDMRRARDKRADDARRRLGRDESEEEMKEREKRDRAEDARRRLGRDESEEERMERERDDDAEDAAHKMHRDAADAMRRARDACRDARDSRRAADARRRLGRDESEEEREERSKKEAAEDAMRLRGARDEPAAFKGMPKVGGKDHAMDEASIKRIVDRAVATNTARIEGVHSALREVRPWVGEIRLAFDSADAVFEHALKSLGISTKEVHPTAFRTILLREPKPGATTPRDVRMAADAASAKGFAEMFPGAARIKVVG